MAEMPERVTFCITGKLARMSREEVAWLIEKSGNRFRRELVKGEVDYLVMADPNTKSGKAVKAKKWGIKCIGEDKMREICGFSKDDETKVHAARAKADSERPVTWERLCRAICRRTGGVLACRCESEWLSDHVHKSYRGKLMLVGEGIGKDEFKKTWCSAWSGAGKSFDGGETDFSGCSREAVFEQLVRELFSQARLQIAADLRRALMSSDRAKVKQAARRAGMQYAIERYDQASISEWGRCIVKLYDQLPAVGEFDSPMELKLKLEIAGWEGMLTDEDLADGMHGMHGKPDA